jgi:hypothetical protein
LSFSMLKSWNQLICHNIKHRYSSNPLYRRVQVNQRTLHFICHGKRPNKGYSLTAAKQCCFSPRAWNSLSFMSFGTRQCLLLCSGMEWGNAKYLLCSRTKWGSARSGWGSNESLPLVQFNWMKQC